MTISQTTWINIWRWSCHVLYSGLIIAYLPFVPENLRFSPLPWSQTLGPEEPQRLKVNGVDSTLEEEEVNPGKRWLVAVVGNLSSIARRKGSLKSLPRKTSSSRDQEVPLSPRFIHFKGPIQ